jgi:hypothetical protein
MATTFKNRVVSGIGTARQQVLESTSNTRITIVGFSLANLTDGVILVNVELQDETSTIGYYAKDLILPPNTSLRVLNGGEKLILAPSNVLYVNSNTETSVDVIISTVEIV